ncbi:MAG TPA: vitamin K epoxide reductase family protein [Anaerolineaceae bacterium]|nr:vitamin K epoxide reductase family protein [Anaerolineaceae bacterium]
MVNNKFKIIATIIGILGLADSVYLTILKLTSNESMCIKGVGDCWTVNSSIYSQIFGIPISAIGALAYLAFILAVLLEDRSEFFRIYSVYMMFGITLIGVLYSAYLTYLEIAIIRAVCPLCIFSALLMLTLFILTVSRLVSPQVETST